MTRPLSITAQATLWFMLLFLLMVNIGCVNRTENEVVVYAAADREYATPILDAFERARPGTTVARQYDIESTKTIGLVTRIQQEAAQPRCDVFWNNEILHTIRLSREGLLKPHAWPVPKNWPAGYKAIDDTWIGFAARGRVLIVNREKLRDEAERPRSVMDLADPRWHRRCGVAFPLYGTTATHFAVLAAQWPGGTAFPNPKSWFTRVHENAVILSGNKQVAQAVATGQLDWGLTDTDDAVIEKENGQPVEIVYPDQNGDGMGALLIPNCIAVLKKSPHPAAASELADYLVSEKTEARLTMGSSAQFPIWPNSAERSRAQPGGSVRWMNVDFEKAADLWPKLAQELRDLFSNP